MDRNGIGTDATIAEHIKKVLERSYVEKRSALFYPTTIGTMLLKGYTDCGFDLGKPELRAEMERAVDKVAEVGQGQRCHPPGSCPGRSGQMTKAAGAG